MLYNVNATALIVTLAVLVVWLAQAYAKILTKGKQDKRAYWRNVRFIIACYWIFNATMFTMFYTLDGSLPKPQNWVIQVTGTAVLVIASWYFNRRRRS